MRESSCINFIGKCLSLSFVSNNLYTDQTSPGWVKGTSLKCTLRMAHETEQCMLWIVRCCHCISSYCDSINVIQVNTGNQHLFQWNRFYFFIKWFTIQGQFRSICTIYKMVIFQSMTHVLNWGRGGGGTNTCKPRSSCLETEMNLPTIGPLKRYHLKSLMYVDVLRYMIGHVYIPLTPSKILGSKS